MSPPEADRKAGRNSEGESRKSKGGCHHDDSHRRRRHSRNDFPPHVGSPAPPVGRHARAEFRRQKPAVHRRGHGSDLGTSRHGESVFRRRRGEVQLRLSAGVRREAGLRTARGALQALQRSQHQFGAGLLQGASGSARWRGRLVRRSAVGEGCVLVQRGCREGPRPDRQNPHLPQLPQGRTRPEVPATIRADGRSTPDDRR